MHLIWLLKMSPIWPFTRSRHKFQTVCSLLFWLTNLIGRRIFLAPWSSGKKSHLEMNVKKMKYIRDKCKVQYLSHKNSHSCLKL